ncbi:hypothetical protein BJ742DRAFT_837838 [Cladochytrium replicatum]|nr:hypothetical protein BJ742DRAFT_837838 [Cladochytrium replicatum]
MPPAMMNSFQAFDDFNDHQDSLPAKLAASLMSDIPDAVPPPAEGTFSPSKDSVSSHPHDHIHLNGHAVHDALTNLRKDLSDLKSHGAPKLSDIQALAERTWKANIAYESYIKKLEREKETLTRLVESVWTHFDDLLLPLWRIDDSLMPIYEELALLQTQLEALKSLAIDSDERGDAVRLIQERLHRIENENVKDGKIIPGISRLADDEVKAAEAKVPAGQAVVHGLLNRCYRIVRLIQEGESEVAPVLLPLQTRLQSMIDLLSAMRHAYIHALSLSHPGPRPESVVDPLQLRLVQEQLDGIDRLRTEGRFTDPSGHIPEGQAVLTEMLEEAYDLVHECLVEQEALVVRQGASAVQLAEDAQSVGIGTVAAVLKEKVVEARDALVGIKQGEGDETEVVHTAYETLRGAAGAMRRAVVGVPMAALDAASASVVSVVRGGLGFVGRILERAEPVDPSLMDVATELGEIRAALKGLRNQRNSERLRRATESLDPSSSSSLSTASAASKIAAWKQLEELQRRLDEIDNMRSDGKFVDEHGEVCRGQELLHSLLDECFTLVFEVGDDLEAEDI